MWESVNSRIPKISNKKSLGVNTMTFPLMDKRIDSKIKKKTHIVASTTSQY
jgi:hypothetical protein